MAAVVIKTIIGTIEIAGDEVDRRKTVLLVIGHALDAQEFFDVQHLVLCISSHNSLHPHSPYL